MKRTITAIAVLFNTLVQVEPIMAQMIEWEAVPHDGSGAIGINTLVRQYDNIVFDAKIDGEYVRYNGDCQTKMLSRLYIGRLDEQDRPIDVERYKEPWFPANEFQEGYLTVACSL